MRQALTILGFAFLIITVCMIYLVRSGVSLRTEPLIKPSPIDAKFENIVYGITHRLFSSFQSSDYMIVGWDVRAPEQVQLFSHLEREFEKKYGQKVTSIAFSGLSEINWGDVTNCPAPCWIYLPTPVASDIANPSFARALPEDTRLAYFTLTVLPFWRETKPDSDCIAQKRLTLDCVTPVSVREVYRKLKETDIRYFFMRRYNQRDHFLFLEQK